MKKFLRYIALSLALLTALLCSAGCSRANAEGAEEAAERNAAEEEARIREEEAAREEKREIPDIVIPTDLFRSLLLELKCYKDMAHGGKVDGIGIQPSSKKLYERLTAYINNYGESVLFDPDRIYESWELEGLEI